MNKILGIYGAGGLAREVLEVARCINEENHIWDEFVFVDKEPSENEINNTKVISEAEAKQIKEKMEAVIAVGEPILREKIYEKLNKDNINLTTLIHPSVRIPDTTTVGQGTVVCSNAVISCNVLIHDNVYIQPHVVIGHDIHIGKHSVIGANVEIGGANKIGERVFIGFMVGTLQGLTIGDDVEISAGSIVFRDIESGMIVMGNPARVIRKNEGRGVFTKKKES